jgi:hypothetical protein
MRIVLASILRCVKCTCLILFFSFFYLGTFSGGLFLDFFWGDFFRLERRSFGVRVNELVNEIFHNNYHFAIILGISIARWVGS